MSERHRSRRWNAGGSPKARYRKLVLGVATGLFVTVAGGLAVVSIERAWDEPLPKKLTECLRPVGLNGTLGGWGPPRTAFSFHRPAGYPVLNSITDNPFYGDERAFFDARLLSNQGPNAYCDQLQVSDGDIIAFRVYVANSAADELNGPEGKGAGTVRGARLAFLAEGERATLVRVQAFITADNTEPKRIWDHVTLMGDRPFRLDYLSGSGRLYGVSSLSGRELSNALWESRAGTLIGSRASDGVFPPPMSYAVIVEAQARVTAVAQ